MYKVGLEHDTDAEVQPSSKRESYKMVSGYWLEARRREETTTTKKQNKKREKRFRTKELYNSITYFLYPALCASRWVFPLTVPIEARMRETETEVTGVVR